ncbi:VC0807 family protein [Nocardia wallacei]|uniref:VC0807 family protein n=1 Tax=Nocardia wallacei TaxID=480035 RepID=UPI00245596BC|nr:VC0807 family protein [Nocardia wallacei]
MNHNVSQEIPMTATAEPRSGRARNLLFLAASIGLSPAVYYLLSGAGYSDFAALLCSTIVSGLWAACVAAAQRKVDGLAAFAFALNLLGLALALLGGDERMMLVKDPISSAVVSALLLGSCVVGRPATYGLAQRLHAPGAESAARWDALWHSDHEVRRAFRSSTAVWGAGLAADAVLRLALIYALPVSVTVALMNPVQWAIIGLLVLYTLRGRRQLDMRSRLAAMT